MRYFARRKHTMASLVPPAPVPSVAKLDKRTLYGEQHSVGKEASVNIFQSSLTVEYAQSPLARYAVEWQPDQAHLTSVGDPCLYERPYPSFQPALWPPGVVEWRVIIQCETYAPRRKRRRASVTQPVLWASEVSA